MCQPTNLFQVSFVRVHTTTEVPHSLTKCPTQAFLRATGVKPRWGQGLQFSSLNVCLYFLELRLSVGW